MSSASAAAADEDRRRAAEESRQTALKGALTQGARARLSTAALVRPEQARAVEDRVIAMARSGKLSQPIEEEAVTEMLEKVAGATTAATKVTIKRRTKAKLDDDDDDDDDDDLL